VTLVQVAASLLALAAGSDSELVRPAAPSPPVEVGRSARGRPIRAVRVGPQNAPVKVLVVGRIHGDEPGGEAVTARLRRARPPRGVALWIVDDMNPDGSRANTRQNANGVDLNRNFSHRWRAMFAPFDQNYSGTGPLSEPESRAATALIERIRPRLTVWYHQELRMVVRSGGDPALERLYARVSGLPRRSLPPYPGTATSWQNHRFPDDTAFVVELDGSVSSREATRNARAVMALARAIGPPRVVSRPIPFPEKRKQEMRDYAQRHYGFDDYRLRRPRVIVQHYTVTDSFAPVFNTFARDEPDPELHELPGICSHYVIDKDGTVYRLVPTSIMCRHTVGLNWTALGIEHVGRSDGQVMGNRRQLRASLQLTRSLQGRFRILTRNVIGHNESLSSPYHRERVARLRRQTHGDFRRATMRRYRRALERLPAPASVRSLNSP
jgi:N-acetylmuramoyl-L-alanine amidase-like protein/zinc carboxypeptidase